MDYEIQGLTTGPHITAQYREHWNRLGVLTSKELSDAQDGMEVRVAGLVITRQAPSTAKGHVFISLEDEYGTINCILRPDVFKRFKPVALRSSILVMDGQLVHDSGVINILVDHVHSDHGSPVDSISHDFH